MKLATFSYQGRRSIGVVKDDGIADLAGHAVPQTMEEFLDAGELAVERARELSGAARTIPIADIRLHAPVEHPQIPGCRVVNSPIEFGEVEPRRHRGAPELGQHTEEVALEAGLSWEEIARLKELGALG